MVSQALFRPRDALFLNTTPSAHNECLLALLSVGASGRQRVVPYCNNSSQCVRENHFQQEVFQNRVAGHNCGMRYNYMYVTFRVDAVCNGQFLYILIVELIGCVWPVAGGGPVVRCQVPVGTSQVPGARQSARQDVRTSTAPTGCSETATYCSPHRPNTRRPHTKKTGDSV